ncbi:MAG: sugar transferase [Planctomycetota bacterium]|jgi:lipopolysaccharide/colanic/teichoic acid biosynthesis glycosyltransferase
MRLIIIPNNDLSQCGAENDWLRFAISNRPISNIILDSLSRNPRLREETTLAIAVPKTWGVGLRPNVPRIEYRGADIAFSREHLQLAEKDSWFTVSNGRFAVQIDAKLLENILAEVRADVVTVAVGAELLAYREKALLTTQGLVAGFRRLYSDSTEPAGVPGDWPHYVFVRANLLTSVLIDGSLPQRFSAFVERCRSNRLKLRSISTGGTAADLNTEDGLLGLVASRLEAASSTDPRFLNRNGAEISEGARLFGRILFGKNVRIGRKAIIVGPTIVCDEGEIGEEAVVRGSIVGPGISIPPNYFVQNRGLGGRVSNLDRASFAVGPQCLSKQTGNMEAIGISTIKTVKAAYDNSCSAVFRTWPRYSYAGRLKRGADILAAIVVLIPFAPVIPIIAAAIKLSSPGPVFFRDKRQGLHGKVFNCLKFRTMIPGADKIQNRLRALNEADGPQFKISDDPRLNAVGNFLRDTCIDEIPQFFNVLLGQMSVVGPRPSPVSENVLCPSWRDARLSVRPGITGLWQVSRTREPMKDFQEWIYYDIKYVRELSMKMDLLICWQTAKQLIRNFVRRF